jgi:hypothetical protein
MFDCFRYGLDDNEVIICYLKTGPAVFGKNFYYRVLQFYLIYNFEFDLSLCSDKIRPPVGLFDVRVHMRAKNKFGCFKP